MMNKSECLISMGEQVGKLCAVKNEAYGDSFSKCGEFLRLLYPNGIRPDQYKDALGLVRIFDKQMRIATRKDAFGESPFKDIAGYGVLGAVDDEGKSAAESAVQEAINVERRRKTFAVDAHVEEDGPTSLPRPAPLPNIPESSKGDYFPGPAVERTYKLFHYWGGVMTQVGSWADSVAAVAAWSETQNEYSHGYLEMVGPSGRILECRFLGL